MPNFWKDDSGPNGNDMSPCIITVDSYRIFTILTCLFGTLGLVKRKIFASERWKNGGGIGKFGGRRKNYSLET